MVTAPKSSLLAAIMLCSLTGISSVAVIAAAALDSPPAWFLFAFEVVILLACIIGCLIGIGRFAEGPAIGLACIAGCIAVGSLLGYFGAGKALMGRSLTPYL